MPRFEGVNSKSYLRYRLRLALSKGPMSENRLFSRLRKADFHDVLDSMIASGEIIVHDEGPTYELIPSLHITVQKFNEDRRAAAAQKTRDQIMADLRQFGIGDYTK